MSQSRPLGRNGAAGVDQPGEPRLVRAIRRWDLLGLTINAVIGAGIFGLPGKVFALSGSYSVLAFLACAVVASTRVLCYAEVASRLKDTGGPYLIARRAFGRLAGFEVGWLDWISLIVSFGAACNLFADYLGHFWPAASGGSWRAAAITAIVVGLAGINIVGVRMAALASNALTIAKLLPLALFVGVGLFFLRSANFSFTPAPTYAAFSTSTLLLLFAFGGFGQVVVPAGEMRDPRHGIPFGLLGGLGVVTLFYVLIQLVCIGTLPGLAGSDRPLADASSRFLGPAGAAIVSVGALLAIAGSLHVLMLAAPRILFAMAEQGQLPHRLTSIHRRWRTPHLALALSAALMLVVTLTRTFLYAITMAAIARLLIMIAVCASLPVLRLKDRAQPAGFLVPGGWLVSIAALTLCGWLLFNSPSLEARDVGIAAGSGLLIHLAYTGSRRRAAVQRQHQSPS